MRADATSVKLGVESLLSSLAFRCMSIVLVYVVLIMGLFSAVGYLADSRLNSAFPSIDDLEENRVALENDSFNELRNSIPPSAQMVIFDQNGNRLYASDDDVAKSIDANDLEIINGTEEDQVFYEVLQRFDARYGTVYEINLCGMSGIGSSKIVLSSCVCKLDGTIVEGDLFAGRESLSKRELSLINGEFSANKSIQKLEYVTVDNQPRTLVFISSNVSEATYDELISQNGMIWLSSIPVAVAFTAIAAVVLVRMIRRAAKPLDAAITACKEGGESPDGMHRVPAELVPTYDNFLELMEELKAAQNDKQRIVSDISHDLKTPLTVIRGYAQAFEDGCVPPEKAGEYLRAMKEKTDEASQLIDSLFLYAKTNHPSYSPQLVRMDVCEAVRRIAVEMLPTIEQRACRLDAAIPDDPIWVRADGSLLARVLGNLINNACVHNPGGVTVRLTCKRTESEAVIAVADDGARIPESIRDHVFEPFVTSNDARESGKGTGLGLSIAKRFIDLQGGTIAVSAQPEEDFETEIVVTLPLA